MNPLVSRLLMFASRNMVGRLGRTVVKLSALKYLSKPALNLAKRLLTSATKSSR